MHPKYFSKNDTPFLDANLLDDLQPYANPSCEVITMPEQPMQPAATVETTQVNPAVVANIIPEAPLPSQTVEVQAAVVHEQHQSQTVANLAPDPAPEEMTEEYPEIKPGDLCTFTNHSKSLKTIIIHGSIGKDAKITLSGCILKVEGSIDSNVSINILDYRPFEHGRINLISEDGKIIVDNDIGDNVTINNAWQVQVGKNIGKSVNILTRSDVTAYNIGDYSKIKAVTGQIYADMIGKYVELSTTGNIICNELGEYSKATCAYYKDAYLQATNIAKNATVNASNGYIDVSQNIGDDVVIANASQLDVGGNIGNFVNINAVGNVTAYNVGDHTKIKCQSGQIYLDIVGKFADLSTDGTIICNELGEYSSAACGKNEGTYFQANTVAHCASVKTINGDIFITAKHASAVTNSIKGHRNITEETGDRSVMDYIPPIASFTYARMFAYPAKTNGKTDRGENQNDAAQTVTSSPQMK